MKSARNLLLLMATSWPCVLPFAPNVCVWQKLRISSLFSSKCPKAQKPLIGRNGKDDDKGVLSKEANAEFGCSISSSRRNFIQKLSASALMGMAFGQTVASAACLSGDPSVDCIGVYKMPIDDAANAYVESPEILKRFAPDVRWVPPVQYPKTYQDAFQQMKAMKVKANDLEGIVLKGNLTQAGIEVLTIVPKVTVSGRVIVEELEKNKANLGAEKDDLSMRAYRAEVALLELLVRLGQTDVMIGQAISGQLGSLTAGQIQILAEVKEANEFFTELITIIPDDIPKK